MLRHTLGRTVYVYFKITGPANRSPSCSPRMRRGRKPDIVKAPMEKIMKQFLIALFAFAALTTSAKAHGLNNHVCHKHGAYGYHCHP
jgi:hypothetical protein